MRQCQIIYLELGQQLFVFLLIVSLELRLEAGDVNDFVSQIYVMLDLFRGTQLLENLEEPCGHI